MIKAIRKNQSLIDDILHASKDEENFHIWWLGQSGYLLQYKNIRILIDPYLSDSLTKKYEKTEKPHVRISELVISPSELPRIDYISSSHNHTDHLDAETIIPILKNNSDCKLIIPEANRSFVCERLQLENHIPIGLDAGESYVAPTFSISAIPAAHNTIEKDERGKCRFLGYIIKLGKWSIYHSGDTLLYEEMISLIKQHNPNLALLPINGNDPARKVAGNLNAKEAVLVGKKSNIPVIIPCHYDLFEFNTVDVNEFIHVAQKENQGYCVLDLGGKFSSHEFQNQVIK
jgi:L-ascorbate metabolism protein UlaG (beta-lactamase superfamily)